MPARPFRDPRRLFPLLAPILLAATACHRLHELFPSHEDVFKPVAARLGQREITGADTAYVLAGRGWVMRSHEPDLLPDAKAALDESAYQFRRFFGVEPPVMDVRLRPMSYRQALADTARALGDSGGARTVVLPIVTGTRDQRLRAEAQGIRLTVNTRPVVDAWVVAALVARRAAADSTPGSPRAPALPGWLALALADLVSPSPLDEVSLVQLARQEGDLLPLRTLLALPRPEFGRGAPPAGATRLRRADDRRARRAEGDDPGTRLEGAELLATEAYAVLSFLAEREGPRFVGRLAEQVASGVPVGEVLGRTRSLPSSLDLVDAAFHRWVLEHRRGDDAP